MANALKHGAPDQPVRVLATTNEQSFELAVANQGEPIDPVVMRQLFQPFFRGRSSNQGLGLGLYIASEIARAHGGKIEVASSEEETHYPAHSPHLTKKRSTAFDSGLRVAHLCAETGSPTGVPPLPAACGGSLEFQQSPKWAACEFGFRA